MKQYTPDTRLAADNAQHATHDAQRAKHNTHNTHKDLAHELHQPTALPVQRSSAALHCGTPGPRRDRTHPRTPAGLSPLSPLLWRNKLTPHAHAHVSCARARLAPRSAVQSAAG